MYNRVSSEGSRVVWIKRASPYFKCFSKRCFYCQSNDNIVWLTHTLCLASRSSSVSTHSLLIPFFQPVVAASDFIDPVWYRMCLNEKIIHHCREHTMYSIEYSVSIIPEKCFQILYDILDVVSDLLQMANERVLMLRALSVLNSGTTKDGWPT